VSLRLFFGTKKKLGRASASSKKKKQQPHTHVTRLHNPKHRAWWSVRRQRIGDSNSVADRIHLRVQQQQPDTAVTVTASSTAATSAFTDRTTTRPTTTCPATAATASRALCSSTAALCVKFGSKLCGNVRAQSGTTAGVQKAVVERGNKKSSFEQL
jgi:hypothetical protein